MVALFPAGPWPPTYTPARSAALVIVEVFCSSPARAHANSGGAAVELAAQPVIGSRGADCGLRIALVRWQMTIALANVNVARIHRQSQNAYVAAGMICPLTLPSAIRQPIP